MKAAMPVKSNVTYSFLHALAGTAFALGVFALASNGHVVRGPVSHHMLTHIALMNLIAPGVALLGFRKMAALHRYTMIWVSTLTQLFLFLFWHAPPGIAEGAMATFLMHASLAAAALWFWSEILRWRHKRPWMTVAALVVTGKIICLVAALYVFAPRALYSVRIDAPLADQHLAGMLMLAVCPLTYLGAALLITIAAYDRQSNIIAATYKDTA